MVKRVSSPQELIQNVIDGENAARAKRRLVAMGGSAVRPLLEAMVGDQGPLRDALPELVDILERIAKRDVDSLIPALKNQPALNIVVSAVGRGAVKRGAVNRRAHRALVRYRKHEDGGIRAVASYHLERVEKATRKKRKVSPVRKKTTTRRAGVKKAGK